MKDIIERKLEQTTTPITQEIADRLIVIESWLLEHQNTRTKTHDQIRADFGLDAFVKNREHRLQAQQETRYTTPQLVHSAVN